MFTTLDVAGNLILKSKFWVSVALFNVTWLLFYFLKCLPSAKQPMRKNIGRKYFKIIVNCIRNDFFFTTKREKLNKKKKI